VEKQMHRNIGLLYAFKAIKTFLIIMPVIIPFFQELGLNQTEIFILESTWAASILIFEIPSGYFADKFGRKLSMIIGSVLMTLANFLYVGASGFEILLIANLLMGLSYSFISGADSAIAFDSFAVLKQEPRYLDFESKNNSISGFLQASASLLGGALALSSLKLPMLTQACVMSLSIPVSIFLTETPHLMKVAPLSLKELIKVSKNTLFERKNLQLYILLSILLGNMTHIIIWIKQPLFQHIGIPLMYFGALSAITYVTFGITSIFSEKIKDSLGEKKSLIFLLSAGSLAYIIIGLTPSFLTLILILIISSYKRGF
jgi:MFS family permease